MAKSIMIQGAGSNVGKSMLVAGICRVFARRGLQVRPFKPQNMSNNAAVTVDGGEIGRAQALQARACNVDPHTDMNPVLLKPESETGSQVVVNGKRLTTVKAREYAKLKPQLLKAVIDSFDRLKSECDLVVVEGAGSPAEINLRAGDIANMGFAEAADVPVVLVGDIDRGGVIAQLVGTKVVLDAADEARIKGFIVNKFRGDPTLFDGGREDIIEHTGWADLGVAPWFANAHMLPAEDALDIPMVSGDGQIKIAVPRLSRIANFDDLDPLKLSPNVTVEMIGAGVPLPGDADLILIPGSKSTIADLAFFRAQGWDIDLAAHIRRGGQVLGVCGGYQMLGKTISDPDGIEGAAGTYTGLGHLNVDTLMTQTKTLTQVMGTAFDDDVSVSGYEIHIGSTDGADTANAWLKIKGKNHGAATKDGQIRGCYLHGLFSDTEFRDAYLGNLSAIKITSYDYDAKIDETLDQLADHLEKHLDLDELFDLAR